MSNPLTEEEAEARDGADAAEGRETGAATEAGADADGRAVGGGGATGAPAAVAAATGAAAEGGGAAAGEGILIVGADVGLGGSAIRTVSFFGCTLAASAGFGGRAPGVLGTFSDIKAIAWQPRDAVDHCQCIMPQHLYRER